jgi:hypothetical protein
MPIRAVKGKVDLFPDAKNAKPHSYAQIVAELKRRYLSHPGSGVYIEAGETEAKVRVGDLSYEIRALGSPTKGYASIINRLLESRTDADIDDNKTYVSHVNRLLSTIDAQIQENQHAPKEHRRPHDLIRKEYEGAAYIRPDDYSQMTSQLRAQTLRVSEGNLPLGVQSAAKAYNEQLKKGERGKYPSSYNPFTELPGGARSNANYFVTDPSGSGENRRIKLHEKSTWETYQGIVRDGDEYITDAPKVGKAPKDFRLLGVRQVGGDLGFGSPGSFQPLPRIQSALRMGGSQDFDTYQPVRMSILPPEFAPPGTEFVGQGAMLHKRRYKDIKLSDETKEWLKTNEERLNEHKGTVVGPDGALQSFTGGMAIRSKGNTLIHQGVERIDDDTLRFHYDRYSPRMSMKQGGGKGNLRQTDIGDMLPDNPDVQYVQFGNKGWRASLSRFWDHHISTMSVAERRDYLQSKGVAVGASGQVVWNKNNEPAIRAAVEEHAQGMFGVQRYMPKMHADNLRKFLEAGTIPSRIANLQTGEVRPGSDYLGDDKALRAALHGDTMFKAEFMVPSITGDALMNFKYETKGRSFVSRETLAALERVNPRQAQLYYRASRRSHEAYKGYASAARSTELGMAVGSMASNPITGDELQANAMRIRQAMAERAQVKHGIDDLAQATPTMQRRLLQHAIRDTLGGGRSITGNVLGKDVYLPSAEAQLRLGAKRPDMEAPGDALSHPMTKILEHLMNPEMSKDNGILDQVGKYQEELGKFVDSPKFLEHLYGAVLPKGFGGSHPVVGDDRLASNEVGGGIEFFIANSGLKKEEAIETYNAIKRGERQFAMHSVRYPVLGTEQANAFASFRPLDDLKDMMAVSRDLQAGQGGDFDVDYDFVSRAAKGIKAMSGNMARRLANSHPADEIRKTMEKLGAVANQYPMLQGVGKVTPEIVAQARAAFFGGSRKGDNAVPFGGVSENMQGYRHTGSALDEAHRQANVSKRQIPDSYQAQRVAKLVTPNASMQQRKGVEGFFSRIYQRSLDNSLLSGHQRKLMDILQKTNAYTWGGFTTGTGEQLVDPKDQMFSLRHATETYRSALESARGIVQNTEEQHRRTAAVEAGEYFGRTDEQRAALAGIFESGSMDDLVANFGATNQSMGITNELQALFDDSHPRSAFEMSMDASAFRGVNKAKQRGEFEDWAPPEMILQAAQRGGDIAEVMRSYSKQGFKGKFGQSTSALLKGAAQTKRERDLIRDLQLGASPAMPAAASRPSTGMPAPGKVGKVRAGLHPRSRLNAVASAASVASGGGPSPMSGMDDFMAWEEEQYRLAGAAGGGRGGNGNLPPTTAAPMSEPEGPGGFGSPDDFATGLGFNPAGGYRIERRGNKLTVSDVVKADPAKAIQNGMKALDELGKMLDEKTTPAIKKVTESSELMTRAQIAQANKLDKMAAQVERVPGLHRQLTGDANLRDKHADLISKIGASGAFTTDDKGNLVMSEGVASRVGLARAFGERARKDALDRSLGIGDVPDAAAAAGQGRGGGGGLMSKLQRATGFELFFASRAWGLTGGKVFDAMGEYADMSKQRGQVAAMTGVDMAQIGGAYQQIQKQRIGWENFRMGLGQAAFEAYSPAMSMLNPSGGAGRVTGAQRAMGILGPAVGAGLSAGIIGSVFGGPAIGATAGILTGGAVGVAGILGSAFGPKTDLTKYDDWKSAQQYYQTPAGLRGGHALPKWQRDIQESMMNSENPLIHAAGNALTEYNNMAGFRQQLTPEQIAHYEEVQQGMGPKVDKFLAGGLNFNKLSAREQMLGMELMQYNLMNNEDMPVSQQSAMMVSSQFLKLYGGDTSILNNSRIRNQALAAAEQGVDVTEFVRSMAGASGVNMGDKSRLADMTQMMSTYGYLGDLAAQDRIQRGLASGGQQYLDLLRQNGTNTPWAQAAGTAENFYNMTNNQRAGTLNAEQWRAGLMGNMPTLYGAGAFRSLYQGMTQAGASGDLNTQAALQNISSFQMSYAQRSYAMGSSPEQLAGLNKLVESGAINAGNQEWMLPQLNALMSGDRRLISKFAAEGRIPGSFGGISLQSVQTGGMGTTGLSMFSDYMSGADANMFMGRARGTGVNIGSEIGAEIAKALMQGMGSDNQWHGGLRGLQEFQQRTQYNMQMTQQGWQRDDFNRRRAIETGQGMDEHLGFLPANLRISDRDFARERMQIRREQFEAQWGDDGWARQDRDMQLRQFAEKWNFGWGKMQTQFGWQQEDIAFGRNQQLTQRGWQAEDAAFQRGKSQLEFGWQMEDFDRNISMARGRDRINMLREQERAVIRFSMDQGQMDTNDSRREQISQWEDERYAKEVQRTQERQQWAEQEMLMDKRHFEERNALEEQRFEMNMQWEQQLMDMDQRRFDRDIMIQDQELATQEQRLSTVHEYEQTMAAISALEVQIANEVNAREQATLNWAQQMLTDTEMLLQIATDLGAAVGSIGSAGASGGSSSGGSSGGSDSGAGGGGSSGGSEGGGNLTTRYKQDPLFAFFDTVHGKAVKDADAQTVKNWFTKGVYLEGRVINQAALQYYSEHKKIPVIPNYLSGGFTGYGDKTEVAGMVHKQEYVIPSEGVPVIRGDNPQMLKVSEDILEVLKQIAAGLAEGKTQIYVTTSDPSAVASGKTTLADQARAMVN